MTKKKTKASEVKKKNEDKQPSSKGDSTSKNDNGMNPLWQKLYMEMTEKLSN